MTDQIHSLLVVHHLHIYGDSLAISFFFCPFDFNDQVLERVEVTNKLDYGIGVSIGAMSVL